MSDNFFTTNNKYLVDNLENIRSGAIANLNKAGGQESFDIHEQLTEISNEELDDQFLVELLSKLYSSLHSEKNADFIQTTGFSTMYNIFSLINHKNSDVQAYAYLNLEHLADLLDYDELVENMMNQLICITWNLDNGMDECYNTARLSAVYFALFGKGLQKMTKARDWMLFLPFLSNYVVKTIDIIQTILRENSIYFYSENRERSLSKWEQTIVLTVNNYLDFITFIHTKTVSQDLSAFPYGSSDIGLENGDTKRRYLGYYLQNLLYSKIIANFDLHLSSTYYEHNMSLFHPYYNQGKKEKEPSFNYFKDSNLKPMFDIVHRCIKLSKEFGFSFENMCKLESNLMHSKNQTKSIDDELYENDRQMINARLYPLDYDGIAVLFSASLYDTFIYPYCFEEESKGMMPINFGANIFQNKYLYIILNLITRPADHISRTDKGVYSMLYLFHSIASKLTIEDISRPIAKPGKSLPDITVSSIIMYLSSAASTCPDNSLRFLCFKLIEKILDLGDDETRFFFLFELIEACPFPSMNTAAIGLLKTYIQKARDTKNLSVFLSPVIVDKFFPVIFKFKPIWETKSESFWDDYNYIMEALNLYYFLLSANKHGFLTQYSTTNKSEETELISQSFELAIKKEKYTIQKSYIKPLENLIQSLDPLRVNTMQLLITWINSCTEKSHVE